MTNPARLTLLAEDAELALLGDAAGAVHEAPAGAPDVRLPVDTEEPPVPLSRYADARGRLQVLAGFDPRTGTWYRLARDCW